ncbi:MAG: ATP-binding cassette domain-containing protein [Selenomonadaceae bacterium]|nr:ATP-binding cassette domain-containing protein [Selenomonadaceae bacterium]MBR0103320.1 ATP-binding cassette domain-containing protein [Selenomonadaceae bacterium]
MDLRVSIKKRLRDFTLDIDFKVRDEVFALFGASGCGKSMTLKCIAGIETPDCGSIILDGRTLFDSDKNINLPPQARRVGYLFQNYALFPNMTVAQNITFAATGDKPSKLKQNIERFQLHGLENAYPNQLSGGQCQRVALARVLASHAEFLLLDEPFSALDSFLKWQLELELAQILKQYGGAILVTHDRGEVFRLSDSVAVIHDGRISTVDSTRELFLNPKTLQAAILTGCNVSRLRKIADNQFLAVDWDTILTAPPDSKFVAVRAPLPSRQHFDDQLFFLRD